MTTIINATIARKMTRRDLSALMDQIMDQKKQGIKLSSRQERIYDTYLRIASYRETGRKLDYISWDVCPRCGCMCSLNDEEMCGECEYNIATAARHSSLWDDLDEDEDDECPEGAHWSVRLGYQYERRRRDAEDAYDCEY